MNLGGFPTYASLTLPTRPTAYSKAGCEVSFGRERNYASGVHAERSLSAQTLRRIIQTQLYSHRSSVLLLFNTNAQHPADLRLQAFYPTVYL